MIRRLPVLFTVLFEVSAFAQGSRFGSPSGFGNINYPGTGHPPAYGSGFGNINFPGTGRPPQFRLPGAITDPTFASRLGATVRGYPSYTGVARGVAHPYHGRQVVIPVPIIVGGYYPYDSGAAPGYQDTGAPEMQQATPAPPPVVIINQAYRPAPEYPEEMPSAAVRRYDSPVHPMPDPNDTDAPEKPVRRTRSTDDDKATIYLIAFKDHTILPSLAYWVEGDTLNYITEQGTPNRASLSLIDRDFSKRLNRERQVEFSLPE